MFFFTDYTQSNHWGVLLTAYNGAEYTYDEIGNAYGIALNHLILGSYYAADFPTEGPVLENE